MSVPLASTESYAILYGVLISGSGASRFSALFNRLPDACETGARNSADLAGGAGAIDLRLLAAAVDSAENPLTGWIGVG